MSKEKIISKLKELTGKSRIILTRRGNKALKFTLKALRAQKKVLMQDQGGWLTYPQYADELKFQVVKLKTDYGLIDEEDLKQNLDCDSVILVNSMPGYFAYEDMQKIAEIAKSENAMIVNDVSGSIGTEEAKVGDIIFGSFGKWKPINAEYGGFIATNDEIYKCVLMEMPSVFEEKYVPKLLEKLEGLDSRIKKLKGMAAKVKGDLKDLEIIHPAHEGFNVVVKYNSYEEKEKVLKYCEEEEFEFTECPRYIRVNEKAICIEVKRRE